MLELRYRKAWLTIGVVMVLIATVVCLVPAEELPGTPMSDKWQHFLCYAVLMSFFAGLYPRSRYWIVALAFLFMGVAIEFAQDAMKLGRDGDVYDMIANGIGVAIGIALSLLGLGRWAVWIESLAGTREPTRAN
jgi:VanZ family protein